MKGKPTEGGQAPAEAEAVTAVETPVQVWFEVTEHAAIIGECHHAKGKRMQLPKPVAEECVAQGQGKIVGVVG